MLHTSDHFLEGFVRSSSSGAIVEGVRRPVQSASTNKPALRSPGSSCEPSSAVKGVTSDYSGICSFGGATAPTQPVYPTLGGAGLRLYELRMYRVELRRTPSTRSSSQNKPSTHSGA